MEHFDFGFKNGDETADLNIDLRAMSFEDAITIIDRTLTGRSDKTVSTVLFRIDPATAASGETLFQPLGRAFVARKKNGAIERCLPVVNDNFAGFHVTLPR